MATNNGNERQKGVSNNQNNFFEGRVFEHMNVDNLLEEGDRRLDNIIAHERGSGIGSGGGRARRRSSRNGRLSANRRMCVELAV